MASKRIQGSALVIVLVLSLVVLILLGGVMVFMYHTKTQIYRNFRWQALESNALSAIHVQLAKPEGGPKTVFDLYGKGKDSVLTSQYSWGVWGIISVKAFAKKDTISKMAIFGYPTTDSLRSAIYMVDQNRPLSIAGNTEIVGPVYLPEAGIKRGYIEGMGYMSIDLVKGAIRKSGSKMPPIDEGTLSPLKEILAQVSSDSVATITTQNEDLLRRDSLVVSFASPMVTIATNQKVDLGRKVWKGPIRLTSTKPIRIKESTQLEHIILVAPSILVDGRFKGKMQAFATDSITVGSRAALLYPSCLGLVKNRVKKVQPFISIADYSTVSGLVFTHSAITDRVMSLVQLSSFGLVRGQIFADGFAEIKGRVQGNVTCQKFFLRTPSSIYENYLLDAKINSQVLPTSYVGSKLIPSAKNKKIIQWVE